MKKFAFVILLLLPLITFGQAEKRYRSIIIDSVKALNGGLVNVKDTLLLDSLAQYNTDLSSQYTSRSLVDSAFVGVAVSGGGGANTIYSADDALAGTRVVTMAGNPLTFSGNQTSFDGINAAFATRVALFEDNVGTNLMEINNNGSVGIGTSGFSSTRMTTKSATNTGGSFAYIGQNLAGDFTFAIDGLGRSIFGLSNLNHLNVADFTIVEGRRMMFRNTNASTPISDITWFMDGAFRASILYTNSTSPRKMEFFVGPTGGVGDIRLTINADGDVGIGTTSSVPLATLHVLGDVIIDSILSIPTKDITLGVAVTTFVVQSNKMEITGDAGSNGITTITGGVEGQTLTLTFVDALITLTDDNSSAANTINLPASFTSTANDVVVLEFGSGSWRQVSQSVN